MSLLPAIWSTLTWRKIVLMQILGLTFLQLRLLNVSTGVSTPVTLAVCAISAFGMLLVMLGADEIMARGARFGRTFPTAVLTNILLACAISGVAQWFVGVPLSRKGSPLPTAFLITTLENALWGSFAMLAYLNHRTAQRILAAVRAAEQQRAQLDRQLIDARLAAAEAEVDPKMLLDSLGEIRAGLRQGAPDAERKLETLTQTLRDALTHARAAGDVAKSRP